MEVLFCFLLLSAVATADWSRLLSVITTDRPDGRNKFSVDVDWESGRFRLQSYQYWEDWEDEEEPPLPPFVREETRVSDGFSDFVVALIEGYDDWAEALYLTLAAMAREYSRRRGSRAFEVECPPNQIRVSTQALGTPGYLTLLTLVLRLLSRTAMYGRSAFAFARAFRRVLENRGY